MKRVENNKQHTGSFGYEVRRAKLRTIPQSIPRSRSETLGTDWSPADTSSRPQSHQSSVHALISNNGDGLTLLTLSPCPRDLFSAENCAAKRIRRTKELASTAAIDQLKKNSEPCLTRHLAKHTIKTICSEVMSTERKKKGKYEQNIVRIIKHLYHDTCAFFCDHGFDWEQEGVAVRRGVALGDSEES